MQSRHLKLEPATATAGKPPIVRYSALLHEVVAQVDLSSWSHLLVEDDQGNLVGIVRTDDLLQRITLWNQVERARWLDMPIQMAVQGHISTIVTESHTEVDPAQLTAICDASGLVALMSATDVFIRWESIRTSISEALVDPVTSLPNRAMFERRFAEEYRRAQRNNLSLAVGLVDLDHFKQINDQHGHAIGDQALRIVARHLQHELRSYDFVGRYGGDEFVILCTGCRPGEIDIPINRIQDSVATLLKTLAPNSVPIQLSYSIGIAVAHRPETIRTPEHLVELADQCLYSSKRAGRDCAHKIELIEPNHEPNPERISRPGRTTAPSQLVPSLANS